MHEHHSPTTTLDHTGHSATGVGRLEFKEWSRLIWAIGAYEDVVCGIQGAGTPSAGVDVRVDTSSAPKINLSPAWLAVDEIDRLRAKLDTYTSLEQAANDQYGAFVCVEFGRAVSTADLRWPREEKPHPMMAMRCGGCDQMTLVYQPPRFHGDVVTVACPRCGYELSEDEFSVAALLIEAEMKGAKTAGAPESPKNIEEAVDVAA
ncbi:hypothetical protein MUN77_01770 [Leucobacter allii]|uniref:hypothetical protein n=1 Tax=Leucobacter allii TaxID=2932247 RepID=UPI001FCFC23B|nr:hypothetical protein [Leucobacter allii]UOR02087.1 hypothetical protein MUN77_01770 [Leucobacter allii]